MYITLLLLLFTILAIIFNVRIKILVRQSEQCCDIGSTNRTIWDIPGPLWLPIFGTKWIFCFRYKLSKIHEAYEDFNKRYGEIAVEVTSKRIPIVHLFNRRDIEKVLRYPSKYPIRPPTEIVSLYRKSRPDRYATTGITNEQGAVWYHLRAKLTPHISSPSNLVIYLPALNSICNDFIILLNNKRDRENYLVQDFQDIANLLGLEAVCTLLLGRRMGYLSHLRSRPEYVGKLAAAVKEIFIAQRDAYYGLNLWKHLPTKTYKNFANNEEIIYNIVSKIVDEAILEDGKDLHIYGLQSVFIKILQTKGLDIRDKKSAIIDFIAAGIETMANTLIFTLFYISRHRNAINRIRKEFDDCCDNITAENLSQATFTKACLQETYRINPTAFCLARILEKDMVLSGYEIHAGTTVLCQTMLACRKEENFKDAHLYIPERWLDENDYSPRDAGVSIIAPFGTGKRACPGRRFVEMELLMAIAKISTAFNVKFIDDIKTNFEFLLAPMKPTRVMLENRKINN